MLNITYPMYRQRKALRGNAAAITAVYVAVLIAVLTAIIMVSFGAGAVVFAESWLLTMFLVEKHPSDITREQFERASEDLKVVSLALYARVEVGTDYDGTSACERFYTAYTSAVALEKGTDLGEFWESVRQAENALQEWDSLNR